MLFVGEGIVLIFCALKLAYIVFGVCWFLVLFVGGSVILFV